MKKILLTCLVIINVTVAKAQFVNIPDVNFRNWLNTHGYSSCMNGNMMDISCPAVVNATHVLCPGSNIQDLEGIQYFVNLIYLDCTGNNLTFLPNLPQNLSELFCGNNQLTSLPSLPNLTRLNVIYNHISVLPPLAHSITDLWCGGSHLTAISSLPLALYEFQIGYSQITSLPPLPNSLTLMYCNNNPQLTSLPSLPNTLETLHVPYNNLSSLPVLPNSLTLLWCKNNQLTSLPSLPTSLEELYCSENLLASLPSLPNSLEYLECSVNQLSNLPPLPASIISLICQTNQLTVLPFLPSSLRSLYCEGNQLSNLPSLPNSLNNLRCSYNLLTNIPALPASLLGLLCKNNQLSFIPDLPDSVASLDISNNPGLTCFPKYKKIKNLTWSNTGITCLQNSGTIYNAFPPVNTLPICPPPAATITPAGPLTFCSGGSVTLNASAGSGFTYRWIKNGSLIIGATSQSYAAAASGNYAVEVTQNCGFATSAAVVVTVKSLPSATITPAGPTTFCSGGSVILNAPVAANRSYQWKKGANLISGATLSSYTATTGGSYRVIVTNTVTGCSRTTGSATVVTVNAKPAATITPQGPTTFCAGGSVVLKANSGTGLTYKWKKGGNYISGATLLNYTATTAGTYRVEVTNSNGCTKLSAGVTVTVPCREEDILSENNFDVIVFPNPNSGEFTIEFSKKLTSPVQIELTDELGKVVKRFETTDETVVIMESNLANGIYCLTVRNKDEVVIKKINIVK